MADNPIKTSDLFADDGAIKKLVAQLEQLEGQLKSVGKTFESEAKRIQNATQKSNVVQKQGQEQLQQSSREAKVLARANQQLKISHSEVSQELAKLRLRTQENNQAAKLQARLAKATEGSYNALSAQFAINKLRLNQMTIAQRETTKAGRDLVVNTKQISDEMKRLQAQTGQYQQNVGNYGSAWRGVGDEMSVMPGVMGRAGMAASRLGRALKALLLNPIMLVASAVVGLGVLLFSAVKRSAEFAEQMSKVQAVTGATSEEMKLLKDNALELGSTTLKTADDIAKLQFELSKLGFSVYHILDMTSAITSLSLASGAELARSAAVLGTTMRSMGLAADQARRVADVMALSFSSSALDLEKFAESYKYVGATAKATNTSLEESAAMLSVLANAGISGSMAGTSLRMIMLKLGDESGGLTDKIKALSAAGLSLADANQEAGQRAMTSLLVLADQTEQVDLLTESFKNAGGAADEMARIMTDNLKGDVTLMKSAWDGFMKSIDDGEGVLTGVARGIVKAFTWIIKDVQQTFKGLKVWMDRFTDNILISGNQIKAFGQTVGLVFKAVATSFEALKRLDFKGVRDAFTGLRDDIAELWKEENIFDPVRLRRANMNAEAEIRRSAKEVSQVLTDQELERVEADKERKARLASEKKDMDEIYRAEHARLGLIKDRYERERKEAISANNKQIADLRHRLQAEEDMTETQRRAINSTILSLQQQLYNDLAAMDERRATDELAVQRAIEDQEMAMMEDSFEKRRMAFQMQRGREIEDLQRRLQMEKTLTEAQRDQINMAILAKHKELQDGLFALEDERFDMLADLTNSEDQKVLASLQKNYQEKLKMAGKDGELRMAIEAWHTRELLKLEEDKNKKIAHEKMQATDDELAIAESAFNIEKSSQAEQHRFKLQQDLTYYKKRLELQAKYGGLMSEAEVAIVQNMIKRIEGELAGLGKDGPEDFWDMIGLNLPPGQKQAISESTQFALNQVSMMIQARVQQAEAARAAAKSEVTAARQSYEEQTKLAKDGQANRMQMAEKELQAAMKREKQAEKHAERQRRKAARLESLAQASNLTVASAKVLAQFGFPAALPFLTLMWGTFYGARRKAHQAAKEQYGEGHFETVDTGGSHASGHDTRFDIDRRVERGESWAVFNKKATGRYGAQALERMVDGINSLEFEQMVAGHATITPTGVDVSGVENRLGTLIEQNRSRTYTDSRGRLVEIRGNTKRTYLP